MARAALVTGASGFAARFLISELLENDRDEIVAATHGGGENLPDVLRVPLDVTDGEAVGRVISEVRPDEIYHLAGLTRPASGEVGRFHAVNFGGALNLLEAVKAEAPEATVLLVGSAYTYGRVEHPISETEPLSPVNHYGVSKAAADMLGGSYALEGLHVIRARPFNHSGPGQSPDFVLPTLVRQFAEIASGDREATVRLGNLDSVRDLSDVRDIARGYRLALEKGRPGEAYNFGSGRGFSVRELFELVRREADAEVDLVTEASRQRPADMPFLVADAGKARENLGWEAKIPLRETVRDMLAEDRGAAGA